MTQGVRWQCHQFGWEIQTRVFKALLWSMVAIGSLVGSTWAVGAGACLLEESVVLTIDKGAIVSIGIEQRIEWGGTFESSELMAMLGKLIFKGFRLLYGLGLAVALFMIGKEILDVIGIQVSYDQRSYGCHGILYALQVVMGGQGWRQIWNNAG